jgi:hypothetical protein
MQKLKLDWSGRKLCGEKSFRRDAGGRVSSFTVSPKRNAWTETSPDEYQSTMMPAETILLLTT